LNTTDRVKDLKQVILHLCW